MKLTKDNYFSKEADERYMSVSQYKNFKRCEAMAIAKLTGQYEYYSDAFLVGSYVHAWADGTLDDFIIKHPEILSSRGPSKGQLKKEFQQANEMIKSLQGDPFVMDFLQGSHEILMTGELFGVEWKIMIDVYNPERERFADLKTVRSIYEKYWLDGKKMSFVEYFGYITQMAVYQEIEGQNRLGIPLQPYIIAVSKETAPDRAVIYIDQDTLDTELADVKQRMKRIIQVKNAEVMPRRCERCDYCRKTKKLNQAIHYSKILGGN